MLINGVFIDITITAVGGKYDFSVPVYSISTEIRKGETDYFFEG